MRLAVGVFALVLPLAACAATQTLWFDITNKHRDAGQLKMAAAQCNLALSQSSAGQPIPNGATSTPGLAVSAVGVQMMNQQNFLDQCMMAQGWEERVVTANPAPLELCHPNPNGGEICEAR